jgi:hypothetical protein
MEQNFMVTFQAVLELVETLPESQQEDLVNLIRQRLLTHRRQLLEQRISEARGEFARGEVRTGTAADLLTELSE